MELILERLRAAADEKNAAFVAKLAPSLSAETVLGCRTPALRALAKDLKRNEPEAAAAFLQVLPHRYFDENQLHAFLIAQIKPFAECLREVERFLPYIDNWATCDQLSPAVFRREAEKLLPKIPHWLESPHTYTVRFGIGMLMQHFLDARFDAVYPEWVSAVHSEEYYINMESAWYFATALAKQPAAILPYFTEHRLTSWVHRKAIQKCIESRRIPEDTKAYLRTLR